MCETFLSRHSISSYFHFFTFLLFYFLLWFLFLFILFHFYPTSYLHVYDSASWYIYNKTTFLVFVYVSMHIWKSKTCIFSYSSLKFLCYPHFYIYSPNINFNISIPLAQIHSFIPHLLNIYVTLFCARHHWRHFTHSLFPEKVILLKQYFSV